MANSSFKPNWPTLFEFMLKTIWSQRLKLILALLAMTLALSIYLINALLLNAIDAELNSDLEKWVPKTALHVQNTQLSTTTDHLTNLYQNPKIDTVLPLKKTTNPLSPDQTIYGTDLFAWINISQKTLDTLPTQNTAILDIAEFNDRHPNIPISNIFIIPKTGQRKSLITSLQNDPNWQVQTLDQLTKDQKTLAEAFLKNIQLIVITSLVISTLMLYQFFTLIFKERQDAYTKLTLLGASKSDRIKLLLLEALTLTAIALTLSITISGLSIWALSPLISTTINTLFFKLSAITQFWSPQILPTAFMVSLITLLIAIIPNALNRNQKKSTHTLFCLIITISLSYLTFSQLFITDFRTTITTWITEVTPADIYIQAAGNTISNPVEIPQSTLSRITKLPNIKSHSTISRKITHLNGTPVMITNSQRKFQTNPKSPLIKATLPNTPSDLWVSEAFITKHDKKLGDILTLPGKTTLQKTITGIYYDYTYSGGEILLKDTEYKSLFGERPIHGIALISTGKIPNINAPLLIQTQSQIQNTTLEIFDQTFKISWIMIITTLILITIIILSNILITIRTQIPVLRQYRLIGATRRQITQLITRSLAKPITIAALIAYPLGVLVKRYLIDTYEKHLFGWSFPSHGLNLTAILMIIGIYLTALTIVQIMAQKWLPNDTELLTPTHHD